MCIGSCERCVREGIQEDGAVHTSSERVGSSSMRSELEGVLGGMSG